MNFGEAHSSNYTVGRSKKLSYLVIHYTANNGDTAKGNINYFSGADRNASAHYFVDESDTVWQSVKDTDTAWHCGSKNPKHPECRNSNSIGIEMCSRKDTSGQYYIMEETVKNTAALVKELMLKYSIPIDNVLRHYDVTGKLCPEPFVRVPDLWEDFKRKIGGNESGADAETLNVLTACNVISSPDYWKGINNNNVKELLFNAHKSGLMDKRVDNGISNLDTALSVLESAGLVNSCDDWKKLTEEIKHLKELLINMSNKCKIILQKIVFAEAQGEGERGQTLVANVILNRQKDSRFPNGIYDIVFANSKKGEKIIYQFSPIGDGAYERAVPSESVKAAVEKALGGVDESKGALYFCTKASAEKPDSWHTRALEFLLEHNNHRFYK